MTMIHPERILQMQITLPVYSLANHILLMLPLDIEICKRGQSAC